MIGKIACGKKWRDDETRAPAPGTLGDGGTRGERTPQVDAARLLGAVGFGKGERSMDEHPIERFDPLLRNMLAWHLVEETAEGTWALRPDVARRLNHLVELSRRNDASEVVYFGHTCAACHTSVMTRLRDGRYLCDPCRRAADLAAVATPLPAPEERKARRGPFHRARDIAS